MKLIRVEVAKTSTRAKWAFLSRPTNQTSAIAGRAIMNFNVYQMLSSARPNVSPMSYLQ